MATNVYEVLDDLRPAALDEQYKGSKFERLVKTYLLNDPEWSTRFSDVWLWSEWPGWAGRPDPALTSSLLSGTETCTRRSSRGSTSGVTADLRTLESPGPVGADV